MKKGLFVLLMALLVTALFVSCNPEPEVYACKITVKGFTGDEAECNGTYYLKAGEGENDVDNPEYYKIYTDEDCTMMFSDGDDHPFCINFHSGVLGSVEVPYWEASFASAPAFETTKIDAQNMRVKFPAETFLKTDGYSGIDITLEFTRDVDLVCYYI